MMKSLVSRWPSASSAMTLGAIALAMICAGCGVKAYPQYQAAGGETEPESSNGGSSAQSSSASSSGGSGGQSSSSSAGSGSSGGGESSSSGGAGASGGQSSNEGGQSEGGSSSRGGTSSSSAGGAGSGGKSSAGGTSSGVSSSSASSSGGSTSSGTGVTINGKFVAKEKAVTFIHIGHSNMRGQASKPTSLNDYFFKTEDGLWSYKGSFTLAKEPTAPESGYNNAGPGMAILHSARAAVASGSDVQFISIGFGIGSKTSVDYQKKGGDGVYYSAFMKWAGQLKGKVTFAALVIMLGITERHLTTSEIPGFPDRIAQLVSDIRSDLGEPDLPVLFCDYEQLATGDLAPTGSVGKVIMPLVRQIPSKVSKLVLVPTDSLGMQDDHHFDMQGQKDWGGRVISLMKTNNWFPWK